MKTSKLLRSALSVVSVVSVAAVITLIGCGRERRVRECAEKCRSAAEACEHHHERECDIRGRKCAEECERI